MAKHWDDDFELYVQASWQRLHRACVAMGATTSEAEDLTQTCLVKAYVGWGKVQKADNPDAYVYSILMRTFLDEKRRLNRLKRRPIAPQPEYASGPDLINEWSLLRASLDQLKADQRAVVVLRYLLGFSMDETAAVLSIPPGTVKSRLSRALATLRKDSSLMDLGRQI